MIPLAVPVAFAVLALFAWRYDTRARRAYEARLSGAEKRQFRALRRVHPSQWRAAIALNHAETDIAAAQEAEARAPKPRGRTSATRRNARKRKADAKTR
jgi:hypothetical protein